MSGEHRVKEIPIRLEGPRPLSREVASGLPYPVQALGPLRAAVEDVQSLTQAPLAIPAQSALAVASLAVQGFANVETLGGVSPTSLFLLTIARSGERKSTCDSHFVSILREHEKDQQRLYRDAFQDWQNEQIVWRAKREAIQSALKSNSEGKREEAENDLDALGPEPIAPPLVDRTVSEPTFEGLTRLFATGQPSLGLFSDEGGQFLGGHAMRSENRQRTMAAFNDLWQGNPIRRTRGGEGHMTLFGRRLAVHLMVQPAVARGLMADPLTADTGFLPRFLVCEPPSTIGSRFASAMRRDGLGLAQFGSRLRQLLDVPLPIDPETRELTPRTLNLSEESRALLASFADAIEAAQGPRGDLAHITGTASKSAEQAARIAGVLTLWRNLDAPEVIAEDMADAIDLTQHYLTEASRLANAASVSAEIEKAESLLRWLSEDWPEPEVMVRDVVRLGPGSLRESPKARGALILLQGHGWLVPLPAGTLVRGSIRHEAWAVVRVVGNVV